MKTFINVAQMKLATLQAGQFVETGGYYVKGDAGQAKYLIVAAQAADGYGDHTLANGTVAVLQLDDINSIEKFGAIGDGVADDYLPIQAAFNACKSVLIPKGGNFKTTTQINATSDNFTLTISGKLFGSFGSVPQALLVFSKTPPIVGSTSYVEPTGTIDDLNIIFDGGELDWGVNGTSFVYNYGAVQSYWTYHTLYIDRGLRFKISGVGLLSNALIGNLQCRRAQNSDAIASLVLDGNVWDNSASFTSSPELTGFGTGDDATLWNNCTIKNLTIYNAPSYGINTFNTINVTFENIKCIDCDKGFSAENTFDREVESRTNFNSCEALDCTGVSTDVNNDRSGTGFVIEAGGTIIDSKCKVTNSDIGVRVIQARGVVLDLAINTMINYGVYVSQNGTVSPEVVFGSSFKAEYTGDVGVYSRGANILTFCDGAQIRFNTGYAIYPSNSGGVNYNQDEGILNIGKIVSTANLGIRTNNFKLVNINNPIMFVNNTKGIDVRSTLNCKIINPNIFDGGAGTLSASGIAISIDSAVTNTYLWGLTTDANTRVSNLATSKQGMGQEGKGDSGATTVALLLTDFNDLLAKLRRIGVLNT